MFNFPIIVTSYQSGITQTDVSIYCHSDDLLCCWVIPLRRDEAVHCFLNHCQDAGITPGAVTANINMAPRSRRSVSKNSATLKRKRDIAPRLSAFEGKSAIASPLVCKRASSQALCVAMTNAGHLRNEERGKKGWNGIVTWRLLIDLEVKRTEWD